MWDFVTYVAVACLIASIFKFAIVLFSPRAGVILMTLMGLKKAKMGLLLQKNPKVFFGYGVFASTTTGAGYAAMIVLFTHDHVFRTGGSLWIYVPLSFVWGFTLLKGVESYQVTLLSSCLLGLILSYAGLGVIGPVLVWPLVLSTSLFYHFGSFWLVGGSPEN